MKLWQDFIAPFVFVASLFKNNVSIYEVYNNGAWYNFGYLFVESYQSVGRSVRAVDILRCNAFTAHLRGERF